MSALRVKYSDLEEAFLFAGYERYYWLDKLTGTIRSYGEEARRAVEAGNLDDLPEWMEAEIEDAREVLSCFGELPGQAQQQSVDGSASAFDNRTPSEVDLPRYVSIEQIPSREAFQFMADFTDDLDNSPTREALRAALSGNKPFRRFKDALNNFPEEGERWFVYEEKRRREYIEEWARDQGIEVDFDTDE